MINKKLMVLLLVLLSGCVPGIKKIYEKVQTPGSGYLYFYNYQSIEDELVTLQNAVDSLDKKSNPALFDLLKKQIQLTADYHRMLQEYISDTNTVFNGPLKADIAYAFVGSEGPSKNKFFSLALKALPPQCFRGYPPIPCPPTDSSYASKANHLLYFTREPKANVEIYQNGKLILTLKGGTYLQLTKVRVVPLPRNLGFHNGDIIEIRMPVKFLDNAKILQPIEMQYRDSIIIR
jgi:hypothetical protein